MKISTSYLFDRSVTQMSTVQSDLAHTQAQVSASKQVLNPSDAPDQAGAIQGEIAARINLRWFPGLTQSMRIVWDSKVFNIRSIETDLTGRQEYRLKCVAGFNDGQ